MVSIFKLMKLSLRDVKSLAQDHTAIKWDPVSASESHVEPPGGMGRDPGYPMELCMEMEV